MFIAVPLGLAAGQGGTAANAKPAKDAGA